MPAEERIKNDPRFTFAKTPAEQSIFNTQSAEAQQQEQNDQKQKKQNDEWHWDEKDLTSYVDAKLEELFKQKVFFEEGGMWIKTQCATANGLGRESEAFLSRRKGQLFCTYNLDIEIEWYGKLTIGSSIIGDGRGKVKVSDVAYDNEDPETWVLSNEFDKYGGGACLNPAMKTRDLNEYEVKIDETVTNTLLPVFRSKVQEIVQGFAVLLEKAKKGEKVLDAVQQTSENDKAEDPEIAKRAEEYGRELHMKTVGKKYFAYIEGKNEEAKVSLSCSGINDLDLKEVIKAMQQDDVVVELDLSFNGIKDAGLQQLCAALGGGAAPKLQKLRVTHNEISEVAKRMVTGLKFVRKTLQVEI